MEHETRVSSTAKDFFLHIGLMVSLYASLVSFVTFIFGVIEYYFQDATQYYNYSEGMIRSSVSFLIVAFPIFYVLSRYTYKYLVANVERRSVWIRVWWLYLTLFLIVATLAGDLIVLIQYFLDGEITTRFILKIITIAVVFSFAFWFYLREVRGQWYQLPGQRKAVGIALAVVVVIAVIAGLMVVGSPFARRAEKLDSQRVNDLTMIQSEIASYWQMKGKLPPTLADVEDPLRNYALPTDPETHEQYGYSIKSARTFEICATFDGVVSADTQKLEASRAYSEYGWDNTVFWKHEKGLQCFERTIDPERFPPVTKPML